MEETRLALLQQLIHDEVSRPDIHDKVRECLRDLLAADEGVDALTEEQVKEALRERGVMAEVIGALGFSSQGGGGGDGIALDPHPPQQRRHRSHKAKSKRRRAGRGDPAEPREPGHHPSSTRPAPPEHVLAGIDMGRRYLFVTVFAGSAFVEQANADGAAAFTLHLLLDGQRLRSRPTLVTCNPAFNEGFLFELPHPKPGVVLGTASPLRVALLRTERNGDRSLVGAAALDWRAKIVQQQAAAAATDGAQHSRKLTVELGGIGASCGVPAGTLQLALDLLPVLALPSPSKAVKRLEQERADDVRSQREFLTYAKRWWQEYQELRPSHSSRLVKIYARDETGHNIPVCAHVQPVRAEKLLHTPREAARFVSLIPFRRAPSLGGLGVSGAGRTEQWSSLHSFICQGAGDVEDHALLLCSLLLGFGMDAYVCVGTKGLREAGADELHRAAHVWVLTMEAAGSVVFWESLTAERFLHRPGELLAQPFTTVDCVFNHKGFWANCQPSNWVEQCWLDLGNRAHWKPMDTAVVHAYTRRCPPPPPLRPSQRDAASESRELETAMRQRVAEHRRELGLSTAWSDELSYVLSPAVAAYEMERTHGITVGNEEFQHIVRHQTPTDCTFKAFPIQVTHCSGERLMRACCEAAIARDILDAKGDGVVHALYARVFVYPENTAAVWFMLAVQYRSVD